MWKKRCERTYWAGQQEERLHQRTFWPKQPLTPRPKKLRPLRGAAGGRGMGRGYVWGRGVEEAPEVGARGGRWLRAVTSRAAGVGDYPLLLT